MPGIGPNYGSRTSHGSFSIETNRAVVRHVAVCCDPLRLAAVFISVRRALSITCAANPQMKLYNANLAGSA